MALNNDEKELCDQLDDSGHTDFYTGILAVALYRYNALLQWGGAAQIPTEEILKLVREVYDDVGSHNDDGS